MSKRNFLAVEDWSPSAVEDLLHLAARVKAGEVRGGLEGRVLAMAFSDPDPQLWASLQTAMFLHGGYATGVTGSGDSDDHFVQTTRELGVIADAMAVRVVPRAREWAAARTDTPLRRLAECCEQPVINLGSARRDPCHEIADLITLGDRLGHPEGKRFVLAWCWSPEARSPAGAASAALAAARMGMEIVIARPEGYELDPEDTALIRRTTQQAGGEFVHISDDLEDAVVGADVVYAASWRSVKLYDRPAEEAAARRQLRDWQLTRSRVRGTRGGRAVIMHAGPGEPRMEIEPDVLDLPNSALLDQRRNRLHAYRALLLELLGKPE